jgi:hypothetical protein
MTAIIRATRHRCHTAPMSAGRNTASPTAEEEHPTPEWRVACACPHRMAVDSLRLRQHAHTGYHSSVAFKTEARIIPTANEATLPPADGVPTFVGEEKGWSNTKGQSRSVTQFVTL